MSKGMKTEVKSDAYNCGHCDEILNSTVELKKHLSKFHKSEQSVNECRYCQKTFKHPSILKYHMMKIHETIKNFKCSSCDKAFATNHDLKTHHRTIHLGIKPKEHRCKLCQKVR